MNSLNKSNWLKLIAIGLMTIDHIGAILFPELTILRIIGRFGFPFFVYQLAVGMKHTSNAKQYQIRLFLFTLISQIPYILAFKTESLNIFFTLLLASLLISFRTKWWAYLVFLIPLFLPISYGWFGILLPFLFFVFEKKKGLLWLTVTYSIIIYSLFSGFIWTLLMIISVAFILYPMYKIKVPKINKYFFYWFYPVHLLVLWAIRYFFFA